MSNQDRIIVETYEKKNQLESLSYKWKEKLNGSHKIYAKPESIPDIIALLEQTSEWLYGQGKQSNRGTYNTKIEQVQAKVGDIQKRYDSYEQVSHEITNLMKCLKTNFDTCNSLDKQYEHITPEERQVVLNQIEGIKNWIQNAEQQQKNRPRWENPVVTSQDIKQKVR